MVPELAPIEWVVPVYVTTPPRVRVPVPVLERVGALTAPFRVKLVAALVTRTVPPPAALFKARPSVLLAPVYSKVAPEPRLMTLPGAPAPMLPVLRVPALTLSEPDMVLAMPLTASVPAPALVRSPAPLTMPPKLTD